MNNASVGLVVNNIKPRNNETVGVTSKIEISFNLELNTKTVTNNVLVLRDKNYIYKNNKEIVINKEDIVNCNLSYSNMTLNLVPRTHLENGTRYVVYINGLKDIEGNVIKNTIYAFYTNSVTVKTVDIISPKDNTISTTIPDIKFTTIDNDTSYMLQISKTNDFNKVCVEKFIECDNKECTISLKDKLEDGIYYYRIKALSNNFCDTKQFYIKSISEDLSTNTEDEPEFIDEDLLNSDEIFFIKKDFEKDNIDIDLKLGIISFVLEGKYTIDDIDEFESYISWDSFSLNDETKRPFEPNGTWYVIYDEQEDKSHIIFRLDELPTEVNEGSEQP